MGEKIGGRMEFIQGKPSEEQVEKMKTIIEKIRKVSELVDRPYGFPVRYHPLGRYHPPGRPLGYTEGREAFSCDECDYYFL